MIDLATLTEDWRAVARYSVYRTEGNASQRSEIKVILHADQTYQQAVEKVSISECALRQEANYRPNVMSRPLIGIQLERPAATRNAYLALRQQRDSLGLR